MTGFAVSLDEKPELGPLAASCVRIIVTMHLLLRARFLCETSPGPRVSRSRACAETMQGQPATQRDQLCTYAWMTQAWQEHCSRCAD